MKIGANGVLTFSMLPNGDIQMTGSDPEVDSTTSISETIHPAVLQAAIIKLLGGGVVVTEITSLAFMALPAAIAAIPS